MAVKTLNKQHFTDAAQNALRKEALAMFTRPHPCIAHVYGEYKQTLPKRASRTLPVDSLLNYFQV